jgi:hypothetical protein
MVSIKEKLFMSGAIGFSLFLMAPAVIVGISSWLPVPKVLSASNFVGLCEMTVAIGGGVYLFLALVLNGFLTFRRQVPLWSKILVWSLFAIALYGAVRVHSEFAAWH